MKYLFFILLGLISVSMHAQNHALTIQSLEKSLLEEKVDEEGINLIKEHYGFKDDLYDFRLAVINSYDKSLTNKQKLKIFKNEYSENTDYLQLIGLVKTSNLSKLEYLKTTYPEHFQKKSRQGQRFLKTKVKAKKINSN